jgi:hypothetical protein
MCKKSKQFQKKVDISNKLKFDMIMKYLYVTCVGCKFT